MSADAKVWFEASDDEGYGLWHGVADPDETIEPKVHLIAALEAVVEVYGRHLYWYPRMFTNGPGLVGYSYPRQGWEG